MGRLIALTTTSLLFAGCGHFAVEDLPAGRYALSATAKSGGYEVSRALARDDAGEYCARSHQQALIDSFEDLPAAGLDAAHTSRVTFSCSP
jgi:hypothetical protein